MSKDPGVTTMVFNMGLPHGRDSLLHSFFADVFDVRRNGPGVTEWIFQRSAPIAVELILHRTLNLRARLNGPLYDVVTFST